MLAGLLPIVGGYAFSAIWSYTRYHTSRESGHKLYFRAAFYGLFLVICAFLIHIILFLKFHNYRDFLSFFNGQSNLNAPIWGQEAKIAVLIISAMLGPALAQLLNFPRIPYLYNFQIPFSGIKPFFKWEQLLLKLAIKHKDFEKLILRSTEKSQPLLFTLSSGKVFVGWAVWAPNPVEKRSAVRILPMLSGYRDLDNHKIHFTTDYEVIHKITNKELPQLKHVELEDLEIVLSSDQIVSSHLFDLELWQYLTNEQQKSSRLKQFYAKFIPAKSKSKEQHKFFSP
ncbi:hypothetical protein [Nitrosococcus wardiae]|uniref:Uncharacterized protein n=1 Tax=Nitrosococcus wardiae TaxID=1814290 RepID=A0A4V1AVU3_9GAMM|nr:hypothetical protein [Nitrosococcus wardiae]QBQ54335.1 hypothetical protein E3U44_07290 [Nitrosococcus wardiae]